MKIIYTIKEKAVRHPLYSLLVVFAVVQIVFTLAVFSAGYYKILPGMFNEKGALAGDGSDVLYYWDDLPKLRQNIYEGDLASLFTSKKQIHIRLGVLSYAVMSPVFGDTVLSLEPVNLALYLLMLFLTYRIGKRCYGPKTGLIALIFVGLLPSLLLHTTQPLRDVLFIVLMLAYTELLCVFIDIDEEKPQILKLLALTVVGLVLLGILWLVRDNLMPVYLLMALISIFLLLLKIWGTTRRKIVIYNILCLIIILIGIVSIPKILHDYLPEKRVLDVGSGPKPTGLLEQINYIRSSWKQAYPDSGSNIDQDVEFSSLSDVAGYLPRALEIGVFAPFPNDWMGGGKIYGRLGRIMAGLEMLLTYLIYILAIFGIWRAKNSTKIWLLLFIFFSATAALGLVVANIGALYRMRYFFWILAVILGAGGFTFLMKKISAPENRSMHSTKNNLLDIPNLNSKCL